MDIQLMDVVLPNNYKVMNGTKWDEETPEVMSLLGFAASHMDEVQFEEDIVPYMNSKNYASLIEGGRKGIIDSIYDYLVLNEKDEEDQYETKLIMEYLVTLL